LKAIVLAGGKGTRLAPYTTILPKPLMPIGDLSVLEILIRRLQAHGISAISLAVGYLSELIRAYCRDGSQWGVSITYSQEKEPLGTAGPLGLFPRDSEPVLVLNGDLLTDLNFSEFIQNHQRNGNVATIAVYERQVKLEFGILDYEADGRLKSYIEKPEYTYPVSMGAYLLEPRSMDFIPTGQRFDLPDLMRGLIEVGESVGTFIHKGYWVDIGRVEDYQKALEDFPALKERFLSGPITS
jgi:NDP-mannose synthase